MPFEQLAREIRYAARGLWRDRPFTLTTVSTLTVAIALVTVVFTIFNAYVLRPYAVRDPYSLYEVRWHTRPAGGSGTRWAQAGRTFRWSDYQELQRHGAVFDAVIAERNRSVTSDGNSLVAAFVSGNYFETLGGRVQLGRSLATFDTLTPGAGAVIVLSDQTWTRYFDRNPGVIGTAVRLNDQLLTVVGVMAEEFVGLNDTPPVLWVPATMHGAVVRQDLFGVQQPRELAVIARLRKDTTPEQAAAALAAVMPELTGRPAPVTAELAPQATPAPLTLELIGVLSPVFAAFAVVLLAACANVSNVMLARATARQTEIAMRLSLGASRGRVVAQLLTEGFLIAVMAGVAALGLAGLVIRIGLQALFLTLPPSAAAITRVVPLDFDYRVFAFTLAISGLTTILFALVPALKATRGALTAALRGEAAGMRASTLRNVLVVGQVTASLVLIVLATTLVRNAVALKRTDVGFDTTALFSIRQRAAGPQLLSRAYDALISDARFSSIALTSRNPLFGELPKTFIRTTSDSTTPAPGGPAQRRTGVATTYMHVSPGYFATLGVNIVQGRNFDAGEAQAESHVAVISASAAQALWPGTSALGQTFRMWLPPERPADAMTRSDLFSTKEIEEKSFEVLVIGVAGDIANEMVYEGRHVPHLYLPTTRGASQARSLLVRGRSAADVREAVQAVLRDVDSNPLALEALPLEEAIALQMYPLTVASWIGMVLSAVALALSISGLYGVMTYGVSHRKREIGIRMALGADARAVVKLVLSQTSRLVTIGAAIGMILSCSALAVLRAAIDLKNVSILDPAAFAAATAILLLAGAVAAYLPSRRATRIEPWSVLRAE
jgi:predicted permease